MTNNNQPKETKIKDWIFRIKTPSQKADASKLMLLLHGHLGNEKSMWILTKKLPKSYTFIAPRAPVKTGENQYSWHEISQQWPGLDHYKDLAEMLLDRVHKWCEDNAIECNRFDVMGFSQGAVMAYALAFLYPEEVGKVAALASFIPQGWKSEIDPRSIKNKSFFIAHGTEDEIIPIQKASKAAEWLNENGADIRFCKADIGHKLSADCFKGLGKFFN
jgi:phospholipase/carboxylesterase